MGAMYGKRIKRGEIIISDVPIRWREATLEWLRIHS